MKNLSFTKERSHASFPYAFLDFLYICIMNCTNRIWMGVHCYELDDVRSFAICRHLHSHTFCMWIAFAWLWLHSFSVLVCVYSFFDFQIHVQRMVWHRFAPQNLDLNKRFHLKWKQHHLIVHHDRLHLMVQYSVQSYVVHYLQLHHWCQHWYLRLCWLVRLKINIFNLIIFSTYFFLFQIFHLPAFIGSVLTVISTSESFRIRIDEWVVRFERTERAFIFDSKTNFEYATFNLWKK